MSRLLGRRAHTTSRIAGQGVAFCGNCLKSQPSARVTTRLINDLLAPAFGHLDLHHGCPPWASVQAQPVPARRSCRTACKATDAVSASTTVQGPPPLQVTRSNFAATLPAVKQALQDCQFFSFDCEMTGLYLPNQEDHLVDDVDDRYVRTAAAAEQFLVAQFGLSFFKWTDKGYEARSFNFHLFPSPNSDMDLRFMSQASALAFLASEGFDFNKMIYEGIHFLPLSWRDRHRTSAAAAATIPAAADLDEDEACFMDHLEQEVSSWLTSTAAADDVTDAAATDVLYLPAPSPQFAKLQQRLLAAGIGSSRWHGSSSSNGSSTGSASSSQLLYIVDQSAPGQSGFGSNSGSVMLRKATAEQVEEDAKFRAAHRAEELAAAAGFSQVLELIRDSQKPAVGHNIRFDIAYILAAFVQSPLPKTWAGFKGLVGIWFPGGVYDTKYLAHCLTQDPAAGGGRLLMDTSLGACYDVLKQANRTTPAPLGLNSSSSSSSSTNLAAWLQDKTSTLDDPAAWQTLPAVHHAPGCEAYAAAAAGMAANGNRTCAHEAGYDAYMTGAVFVGLLRMFEIEATAQRSRWQQPVQPAGPPGLEHVQQYAWRQFFSRSKTIEYAALQGPEMVPNRPEVIYLTKFPQPNMRWQDIQKKLAALHLGRPPVSMVRVNGHNTQPTGAYVIFSSGKQAQKALQTIRGNKSWKVQAMTYSDYFFSKYGSSSNDSSSAAAVARAPPAAVAAAAAVADEAPAAGDVLQQLQQKAAAARQRQQERMEEQQQQQQQSELLTNIMSSLDEEAETAASSSNGSNSSAEPSASDVDAGFTSALDGSSSKALAAAALLAERQRRLHLLQQQQQQSRVSAAVPPGAVTWQLKRPLSPPGQ